MTNQLRFFVAGVPVAQGSMSAFTPRGWTRPLITDQKNKTLKPWRKAIALEALSARNAAGWPVLNEPVELALTFYLPRPKKPMFAMPGCKPDVDKLVRGCADALTGVIYRDDSRVCKLTAAKRYADHLHFVGVEVCVTREPSLL